MAPEDDLLKAATAPLTFHDFLDRMRHPSAADLVRSIKSFIVSVMERVPDPDADSRSVQEFIEKTELAFREHVLWVGASQEELESSGEGLEKYLMTKLFSRAFAPLPEDEARDHSLSQKIAELQTFLKPEHLDIPTQFHNETSWLLAQKELQKLGNFKAPRDKLVCILNCCRVINNVLINATMAENKDDPPGADEFLPLLIYVVIKANPPQLHSNLSYISKYRQAKRLVAESAYFFTNLVSAVSFIEQLDSTSVSMDAQEFEKAMSSAKLTLASSAPSSSSSPALNENGFPSDKDTSKHRTRSSSSSGDNRDVPSHKDKVEEVTLEDLEKRSLFRLVHSGSQEDWRSEFRFLYSKVGDLRVGDVESLLREYKELALKYSALRHALSANRFTNLNSSASEGLLSASDLDGTPHGQRNGQDPEAISQSQAKNNQAPRIGNHSDASVGPANPSGEHDAAENSIRSTAGVDPEATTDVSEVIEEKNIVVTSVETDAETKTTILEKFDDKALDGH